MKHFLNLNELSTEDLKGILKQAQEMKDARVGLPKGTIDKNQPLHQHIVALVFEKPSTRTRTSFDVGVRQLGGHTRISARLLLVRLRLLLLHAPARRRAVDG